MTTDPTALRWKSLTPPPFGAREQMQLAEDDGGAHLFLYGGLAGSTTTTLTVVGDGATYDVGTDTWQPVTAPTVLSDSVRSGAFVWYGAGRIWLWGGAGGGPNRDGASFASDRVWKVMPAGGPSARSYGAVVWTGSDAIVWGGTVPGKVLQDGMMFRP